MYKLVYTMNCKLEINMELLPNYNKEALIDVRLRLNQFHAIILESSRVSGWGER
jgi:hypothetical protein